MQRQRVVITVLGGLVNGVYAADPDLVEIAIIDYDNKDEAEDGDADLGYTEHAWPLAQADEEIQRLVANVFGETAQA